MTPNVLALIILDGWGYRRAKSGNAIAEAKTPYWDHLWKNHPHCLLSASGSQVGLPSEQMGNSEVGHMHIGAGRVIRQDLTRINLAIDNRIFFHNPVLTAVANPQAKNNLHILGLLSCGGVHSHEKHIHAMLELAAQHQHHNVYFHIYLDGRDTTPRSAKESLIKLINHMQTLNCGKIASIIGRFYAMDRNQKWERTQQAYELMVNRTAKFIAPDPLSALSAAYSRGESDEFIQATICGNPQDGGICDHDAVISMNFRADRARQLTEAFLQPDFCHFKRNKHPKLTQFVSLTEYANYLPTVVAFPSEQIINHLGSIISQHGYTQLRIAETEKYAHVTYFFNGGKEEPLPGEDRILIPSPLIKHYNLKPEMSAFELTKTLITAIEQQQYQAIICNYANADMVGHSGDFNATVKAIEVIDQCLAQVIDTLIKNGGEAIITADHGNAELMLNRNLQIHTAHTTAKVPAIYIGRPIKHQQTQGSLADLAPTMLHFLNLPIPAEMTGKVLFNL